MIVRVSTRALADAGDIGDWVATEDPRRAASFVRERWPMCHSLGRNPRRYPQRRIGGESFRKATWRGYLIFYRILPDRVEIVRIVHGSRDWATLLGGDA